MDHSVIGKPSGKPCLPVELLKVLILGLSLLLFAACDDQGSAKGGAGQEHNKSTSGGTATTGAGHQNKKSTSGGTAPTDGLIVFVRYLDQDQTKGAIFTMYPSGTHIHQITHPPEGFSDGSPAWSPDGTKVAFHRACRPSHCKGSRILVVDVNTGVTRSVTHCIPDGGWTKEHPPPSSGHYCAGDSDPAFSADSKSIAFRRIIGPKDESSVVEGIFIVGLDGSDPHQVSNVQKRGALEFEDFTPAFSPDGKLLVFERSRVADDHTAVFVQSLDSSGSPEDARQITPWEMGCGDGPEFSTKDNWVLFSCEPKGEGGPSNLYWTHPDNPYVEVPEAGDMGQFSDTGLRGTGLYKLSHAPDDWHYVGSSFSPRFHRAWGDIVVARQPGYGDEGNSDVFRMHIEVGVGPGLNLTKSETLDDAPDWGTHPPSLETLYRRGCDPLSPRRWRDESSNC